MGKKKRKPDNVKLPELIADSLVDDVAVAKEKAMSLATLTRPTPPTLQQAAAKKQKDKQQYENLSPKARTEKDGTDLKASAEKSLDDIMLEFDRAYRKKLRTFLKKLRSNREAIGIVYERLQEKSDLEKIRIIYNTYLFRVVLNQKLREEGEVPIGAPVNAYRDIVRNASDFTQSWAHTPSVHDIPFLGTLGESWEILNECFLENICTPVFDSEAMSALLPVFTQLIEAITASQEEQDKSHLVAELECLLSNYDVQPFGTVGQEIDYSPLNHNVASGEPLPGERVKIIRSGWKVRNWVAKKAEVIVHD